MLDASYIFRPHTAHSTLLFFPSSGALCQIRLLFSTHPPVTHYHSHIAMHSALFSALVALSSLCATASASKYSPEANVLQFENVGYSGYYYPVSEIEALSDGNCTCAKDYSKPFTFDGPLAPLNEEMTVHFRGPINLKKFAYYVTSDYKDGQSNGSWDRLAYYDSESKTANNVTFLANYGHENTCLGNAADYVTSSGLKKADEPEILDDTTIPSALEFAIASSIKCNGTEDCGAYRTDGAAYHGFYGVNKMFLFEFNMPTDDSEEDKKNKTDGYDMPAIWLLNSHILRTSQYPINPNCSSWNTGSGEFDIFEVMNYTERNNFYSTIHDFQGTDDIGTGLQDFGYLQRTPNATMKGGVIFAEDETITVFLSNSTTLDDSIDNSDLSGWLSSLTKSADNKEIKTTLADVTISPPPLTERSTAAIAGGSTSGSVTSVKSSSHKNDAAALGLGSGSAFAAAVYAIAGLFWL